MPKYALFLQARMGSTRLPGKVLLPVKGRPLLDYLLERLSILHSRAPLFLLTTTQRRDDPLETLSASRNIPCWRGSEEDVLARFAEAQCHWTPSVIVRLTADCPLLDPKLIEKHLDLFETLRPDYLSNTIERTFPRGMDIELFTARALLEAANHAKTSEEREHVTPYLWRRNTHYSLAQLCDSIDRSHWRWTVDTAEDFRAIAYFLAEAYTRTPRFDYDDLVQIAEEHPEWLAINSHVEQKPLSHYEDGRKNDE